MVTYDVQNVWTILGFIKNYWYGLDLSKCFNVNKWPVWKAFEKKKS